MPRANFLCNAWPIARTPIGVLSFESSFPPLAHFFIADNISNQCARKSLSYNLESTKNNNPCFVIKVKHRQKMLKNGNAVNRGKDGGRLGYPAKTSITRPQGLLDDFCELHKFSHVHWLIFIVNKQTDTCIYDTGNLCVK